MTLRLSAALATTLSASTILTASPAFAVDETAFANRFVELVAGGAGDPFTYDSVEIDGTTITLNGVGVDGGDAGEIALGAITFEGVTEADGGFTAERVAFDDFHATVEETTIAVTGIEVDGLVLPAKDAALPVLLYDRSVVSEIDVNVKGQDFIDMRDIVTILEKDDAAGSVSSDAQAASVLFDLRAAELDGRATAIAERLDLMTIAGSMAIKATWTAEPGTVDVEAITIDVPEKGKLDVAFAINGYTVAFAEALQSIGNQASGEMTDQAAGMAMLGLAQQLAYVGATIRYEDDGLASPVLDLLAEQQGMDRATMINQTKGVLPFLLAQLQAPEFSAAVTAAVGQFLDNPGSITVSANPGAPVPAPMLMAAGMSAPQSLIQQLNVKVTAND